MTIRYVSKGVVSSGLVLEGRNHEALMTVLSGGTATHTTISDGVLVASSGGYVNYCTINEGGEIEVSGGTVNHTSANSESDLCIYSGGKANDTTVAGDFILYEGAVASNTTVSSGGEIHIKPLGSAYRTTIKSGGMINGFTLHSSAYYASIINGAIKTENATVDYWEDGFIYSGGTATNTTVNSSAFMFIESKGLANRTTVKSFGYLEIKFGGFASSSIVNSYASMFISAGGSASNTVLSSGGIMAVGTVDYYDEDYAEEMSRPAGVANRTTVQNGGILFIGPQGTTNSTTILSGGTINGFTLQNSTYYSSIVSGAVSVKNAVVHELNLNFSGNNCAVILSGGSATQTTVLFGGSMHVSSGATATGLNIADGAVVSMYQGSTLNFDLTQGDSNSAAQVNNLALINGTPDYAITVSGNTKAGTYRLADGASNFNGTITIRNSTANLGSITVGSSLKIGNTSYTLNKKDGQLTLTVTGTTAARTVKSDINGNGISDVMFQYNADHQVGFWLDGKNNWQGQGLAEPAEWQVLGAYDMDSNGKADIVMVGNITINGVKGAYIGFRKDGDTSTWQNISHLTNYNNIEWKVKVGNITGNTGKNSIVWHAPELGALGIWADGTNQWVSITGWFDNSWNMLGTGDFDGDGKDEILLRNNNSLYTVNINSKFTSLGTASDWKVCAIGDFSGDGKDDLVLYYQQTGLVMKYENGQSSQWSTLGQLDAKDWFIVGAGDYDGDGKDDLLVRQYSTGMLGYYSGGDMNRWREMGRGVDMNWAVIA